MKSQTITYMTYSRGSPEGSEEMRFRLTYRGPLKAHKVNPVGSKDKIASHVHSIRRHFHAQLRDLWNTNRFLSEHESYPGDWGLPVTLGQSKIPLVEVVAQSHQLNGFQFVPLVRDAWHLECNLSVLFLRRDQPGSGLIHKGDIDNRIKTLIDALRFPATPQETNGAVPESGEVPFFCLLEDDKLIAGLSVETDRLLDAQLPGEDESTVSLTITVEIRPHYLTMFNLAFG